MPFGPGIVVNVEHRAIEGPASASHFGMLAVLPFPGIAAQGVLGKLRAIFPEETLRGGVLRVIVPKKHPYPAGS
jgi:hypothetical protein